MLIDTKCHVFHKSVRNIVSQWHRQRLQPELYRILRTESVQCQFKHWMPTHFNVFKIAIEEDLLRVASIHLTMGKLWWIFKLIFFEIIIISSNVSRQLTYRLSATPSSIPSSSFYSPTTIGYDEDTDRNGNHRKSHLSVFGNAIAPERKPPVPTMSERDVTRRHDACFTRTRSIFL